MGAAPGPGGADLVVELSVPPDPPYLNVVRMIVAGAALVPGGPGFDDDRLDDLRLVVSEAATNAMRASRMTTSEPVEIRCTIWGAGIEVMVRDRGPGVDPDQIEAVPDVSSIDQIGGDGGLGIPLMRALADVLEFSTDGGGTTVRLVLS